tara:strand:- start:537 stop:1484 length:948 start_codon:yes stop_codon:yes gene_type:complete
MITVITPVYNEEENIEELFSRIDKVFLKINKKYELLFVDNGSKDKSLEIIKKIEKENSQVKFISLTKNFGHQGGIWAGLYNTDNTSIIMDSDLQHPPELIPEIIEKWSKGYKIVNTMKRKDKDTRIWKKIFSGLFYSIVNKLTNLKLSSGQSDFCLIDSTILDIIKKLPEKKIFLRGIINSLGYDYSVVEYECEARKRGKSKFSIFEYLNLAFDGIVSFSSLSIAIFFWLGMLTAVICLFYAFYIFVLLILNLVLLDTNQPISNLFPPGWTSIIIGMLFIGSIQLIGLGILGKYIALTLENVKRRPEFFIKEKSE